MLNVFAFLFVITYTHTFLKNICVLFISILFRVEMKTLVHMFVELVALDLGLGCVEPSTSPMVTKIVFMYWVGTTSSEMLGMCYILCMCVCVGASDTTTASDNPFT
jgi:hypothetical protein